MDGVLGLELGSWFGKPGANRVGNRRTTTITGKTPSVLPDSALKARKASSDVGQGTRWDLCKVIQQPIRCILIIVHGPCVVPLLARQLAQWGYISGTEILKTTHLNSGYVKLHSLLTQTTWIAVFPAKLSTRTHVCYHVAYAG